MAPTDDILKPSIDSLFLQIIKRHINDDALSWIDTKAGLINTEEGVMQLNMAFAQAPRITSRAELALTTEEQAEIEQLLPGFSIANWSIDQLVRVWLLMQVPATDQQNYIKKINGLFTAAEMNELVALYAALPLLHYPEEWVFRCTEGIRSNIGTVLESVMYYNPYPYLFLSENAWNQLVLKAFFTDKDVELIVGLKERNNKALVETLSDYVAERLAANRTVAPGIYKLIEGNN